MPHGEAGRTASRVPVPSLQRHPWGAARRRVLRPMLAAVADHEVRQIPVSRFEPPRGDPGHARQPAPLASRALCSSGLYSSGLYSACQRGAARCAFAVETIGAAHGASRERRRRARGRPDHRATPQRLAAAGPLPAHTALRAAPAPSAASPRTPSRGSARRACRTGDSTCTATSSCRPHRCRPPIGGFECVPPDPQPERDPPAQLHPAGAA